MYIFLFAEILFYLLFHRTRCFPNSLYNLYTADDDYDDDDDGDDDTVAQSFYNFYKVVAENKYWYRYNYK